MYTRIHVCLAGAATLVAALVTSGCTSHYMPTSQRRVSVIMKGGQMAYVRDGEVHSYGFLGRGLMNAVRGDPQAEAAARTFYERNRNGLLTVLAGVACGVASTVLMAQKLEDEPDDVPPETWLAVGCLGGVTTGGLLWILSGQPYQYDAINIFNDNAERRAPGSLAPGTRW
jgi:hypothetical protein